jgi:hypothetical protein
MTVLVSAMSCDETLRIFQQLRPGDRVELTHEVKVGFRGWQVAACGTVLKTERRRHGLHFQRHLDDKVFSDVIVLACEDGQLTSVTLDEFSRLRKLDPASRACV